MIYLLSDLNKRFLYTQLIRGTQAGRRMQATAEPKWARRGMKLVKFKTKKCDIGVV